VGQKLDDLAQQNNQGLGEKNEGLDEEQAAMIAATWTALRPPS